jgi:hypothetical protein
MYRSVMSDTLNLSGSHHHPSATVSYVPQLELPPLKRAPPSPQPQVTTFLLSVSMSSTTLGTSYEWNPTVFVLLWLTYCQPNSLKVSTL